MEYKKLGDVCKITMGQSPDSSSYNKEKFGLPFFQGNADFGKKSPRVRVWCNKPTKLANKNDILISVRAPIGALNYANQKCCIGRGLAAITPDNCHYYNDFIYYLLKSKYDELNKQGTGSTFKAIGKSVLENISIPIISLKDQCSIINILEKCSTLILDYQQELILLDQLIKARFVEMFGDPVINSRGWKSTTLGNLCSKISSGNTPKGGSEVYVDGGIMFFRSQNVWKGHLELDDIAYIDKKTHESMKETKLKYGDILITKTGRINTEKSSLGRSALYLGKDDAANINGHVYLVRLNSNEVNRRFILEILISYEFRDLIRRVCVGGIDKRQLNRNHIEDFPIILPPIELQNQFASFVQQVDKSKFEIQKSLEETQKLFDSLMQKYFG